MDSFTESVLVTHFTIENGKKELFADWQAKLNEALTKVKGFISLEILPPDSSSNFEYQVIINFDSQKHLLEWERSNLWQEFKRELQTFQVNNKIVNNSENKKILSPKATEIFLAQVIPGKEEEYRKWIAKIHGIEARFPGFLGIFVQLPIEGQSPHWITFIQFDSQDNLGNWIKSKEREVVLKEASALTKSLESHRVISSYAGWFSSLIKKGNTPPVWKQTMLILLFLFPIIMLEFKWLPLITSGLNISLSTFIGNAISVTLLAWPFIPIGIWLLSWWLVPNKTNTMGVNILGTLLLLILYLIEIMIFWSFV